MVAATARDTATGNEHSKHGSGRALRPLAEAYASLGQRMIASDLYERALTEAVVNPNSRPRVEDLVKVSISITRSGIEPSRSLELALDRVAKGLGEPW